MRALNLTLLTDLYELTMMQGYFKNPTDQIVVFDAFYRKNPCDGGYAIAAGLDQIIEYVRDLHFAPDDIDYLRSLNIFDNDFLEYLRGFHFTGDIYAIPEANRGIPQRAPAESHRPCYGGAACRDSHPEPAESSEPYRHQSLPRRIRGKRRWGHGIWSSPGPGT